MASTWTRGIALSALLGSIAILQVLPPATAASAQNFDTIPDGQKPCNGGGFQVPCTGGEYTYSEGGTGAASVTATVKDGAAGKSVRYVTSGFVMRFAYPAEACNLSFALALSNAAATLGTIRVGYGTGSIPSSSRVYSVSFPSTNSMQLSVGSTVNGVSSSLTSSVLGFAAPLVINTFYHFQLSCPPGQTAGTAVLYSPEADALGQATTSVSLAANTGTGFASPTIVEAFAGPSGVNQYLDNLSYGGQTTSPKYLFCSDPTDSNFSFTYAEDVVEDGSGEPSYVFSGSHTDFGYLAKGLDTPDMGLNTTFRIRARIDGADSEFRVFYSTVSGLPSSTTKGNGGDPESSTATGSFANGFEVRLQEFGDQWAATIEKIVSGTRSRIETNKIFGEANTKATFQFLADTRSASPRLELRDAAGATIMSRTFPSAQQDLTFKSVWFVGYGVSSSTAATDLYNNVGNSRSSCIYSLTGNGVVNGSPGTDVDSDLHENVPSVTSTSSGGALGVDNEATALALGISSSAVGYLYGILITAGLTGAFFAVDRRLALVGAVVGFGLSTALSYFPLWLALLLVLAGVVVAVMKFRGG
jgi:hypothetical protein